MGQNNIISVECKCRYCEDKRSEKTVENVGKLIGNVLKTTELCQLAILASSVALGVVGFGASGVRAVSFAARVHSWIGNVQKGSLFAKLTSMAMRGASSPGMANGMRAVFQLINMGGAAAETMCKADTNGNLIFPQTQEESVDLMNEAIRRGFICGNDGCGKRIDPELRFLCTSVCACPSVIRSRL